MDSPSQSAGHSSFHNNEGKHRPLLDAGDTVTSDGTVVGLVQSQGWKFVPCGSEDSLKSVLEVLFLGP